VRRVGGDIYRRPSARGLGYASKRQFEFAVKDCRHFLEIVSMRRWSAAMGTRMSIRQYRRPVSSPDSKTV
jgi:hypothetical protein